MIRKPNWIIIAFFAITSAGALVGAPFYVRRFGISFSEILLFLFFVQATGMSITVGYHRFYAHNTFKASRIVQFLILFFGAAAFQQSALTWSSGHRDHHRYVDTDLDPYSIKKGFWYAHIGWMTLWKQRPDYTNVKDLLKNKLVMHQHDHYVAWGVVAGILFPVLLGFLSGHALGALVFSVCVRLTFVYHATWCINSVCHTFGKATYDIYATAKDHWLVAIVTNGEGYHNFHHRFPMDYRNGVRWYHWDPSKWMIAWLAQLGLVWDLKKTSAFRILQAKLAAENQAMGDRLMEIKDTLRFAGMTNALQLQYQRLTQNLSAWETATKQTQGIQQLSSVCLEIKEARLRFKEAYEDWKKCCTISPVARNGSLPG